MNRHYAEGFTRVFTNDLYDVEKQLQDFDPEIYIMWNPHTGEHLIMDGMTEFAIMRIPQIGFPELSSKVVTHIRKIQLGTGFSAVEVLDKSEELRELQNEIKTREIATDFAKEMFRADRHSINFSGVGA